MSVEALVPHEISCTSAVAPQPAQQKVDVKMQAAEIDIFEPDSIHLLIFLLGDFHLCKSATLEQTNLAELSGPSEAPLTYRWLHRAELTVSGVACNGGSGYITWISTQTGEAEPERENKAPFCSEGLCEEYFREESRDEMR